MHFQKVFIPLPSKDYCLTPFILWSRISDRLWHLNKYEACLRQNCETLHAQLSLGFLQILNNQSWKKIQDCGPFCPLSGQKEDSL